MNTATENILNVTLLEPRQKHPTIFVRFDELNEGETLTIHNDHDPKPLYYQLLGERGNVFIWEYTESGPEWWKVNITKRKSGESDETLGEIAAKDLRKAEVFKKYGIDFCCGGKKTVKEACAEKGIDVTVVEQELQQADKLISSHPIPYNEWNLDFLADYIINTHHTYVRKNLPDLVAYAKKVAEVHGSQHPELHKIKTLVDEVNAELTSHMVTEEEVLFPAVKQLVLLHKNEQKVDTSDLEKNIKLLENEHEIVGKSMAEMRDLSNNYALPSDSCASYALLFKMLDEFENDLHLHIHLENNILFKKAILIGKN